MNDNFPLNKIDLVGKDGTSAVSEETLVEKGNSTFWSKTRGKRKSWLF